MAKKSSKADGVAPTHDGVPVRCSPYYLEHIKITGFGRLANRIVGPFSPGLNVVYGPNEAGKTTINELVKGVLFGWPTARKGVNSYRPENAERAGSLFFRDLSTGEVEELKRVKNTDGIDDRFRVLSDIDRETHATMFALTGDELTHLDRHNEVMARLLTAGSGTSASPAHALESINERIKDMMSRSAQNPDSLANLLAEQERIRARMQEGLNEADYHRSQEQKLKALQPRKDTLTQAQNNLNGEIESLKTNLAKLEGIDESLASNTALLEETVAAERDAQNDAADEGDRELVALSNLSQQDEYKLRDSLEDLDEQRIKFEHAIDNARRDAAKSQAEYETLMEDRDVEEEQQRAKTQRRVQLAISIVVPVCMILAGLYMFIHGRDLGSLSYSVLGLVVGIGALIVAAAGVVMNLRPTKTEEELTERRKKLEWVMQQDRKTLEACERDAANHQARIVAFLDNNALSTAQGSLRRARHLMDAAREVRSTRELAKQNGRALALQRASLESLLEDLREQRAEICRCLGLPPATELEEITAIIDRKSAERAQTIQLANDTNRQYGEISQELQQAQRRFTFDETKLAYEMVETKIHEAYRTFASLLVAQRSLEDAIAEWERKSQPEVYRQASRLFSRMTDGVWQQVRMNAAGDIEVVDAVKTVRPPHLLSLGTRQQLYLSLRIALLLTADNVGRALPIMCDDILVNFDDERRVAALEALVELAEKRQVILFTCHPDIVALMQSADSSLNSIEL